MKRTLKTLLVCCGFATAHAQQLPQIEHTRYSQVMTNRATRELNYLGIPGGGAPVFPAYVPDSIKKYALFIKTLGASKGLYFYDQDSATWKYLPPDGDVLHKTGNETKTGNLTITGDLQASKLTALNGNGNTVEIDGDNGMSFPTKGGARVKGLASGGIGYYGDRHDFGNAALNRTFLHLEDGATIFNFYYGGVKTSDISSTSTGMRFSWGLNGMGIGYSNGSYGGSLANLLELNSGGYGAIGFGTTNYLLNGFALFNTDYSKLKNRLLITDEDFINRAPNDNAGIELRSTTKGIQFSRMTASQRAAIPLGPYNVDRALTVYQSDGREGLYTVDGSNNWISLDKGFINLADYLIENTPDSLKWNAAKAASIAKKLPIFVPAGNWIIPLNNQSNLMNGAQVLIGVGEASVLKTIAVTDSTSLLEWRGERTLIGSNITVTSHTKQATINTGLTLSAGDIVFLITKDALSYYSGSNGFNGQRLIVDQYNSATGVVKFQTAFEFNSTTGYFYKNTPQNVTIRNLRLEAPALSTLQGIVVSFGTLNLENVTVNNFGTRGVNVSSSSGVAINLKTSGGYYPSLESRLSGASYGIAVNDLSDFNMIDGYIAGGKHAFSQSYAGKTRGWNKASIGGGADTTMAFGAVSKIIGGTYTSNNDSLYSINQHGIGKSLEIYDATVYYGVAVGGKHYRHVGGTIYGSSTDNTKQTIIVGTGHTDPNAPFGEYVFQDIVMNTSRPFLLDQAVNKLSLRNITVNPVGPVVTSHMFLQNAMADTLNIDGLTHNGNVGDKAYYNFKVKSNNTRLKDITLNNSYLIVTSDNTDSLSVTADHVKVRGADKDGVKFTSTTGKVFLKAQCDYCDVEGSVNSGVNMGQSSSVTVVRNAFVTNSPLKNNGTSGTNAYGFLATGANFIYAAGNDFTSTVNQKNAIRHGAPPSGTDSYVIKDNILLGQSVAPISVSGTAVVTWGNVTETGLELVNNFQNVVKVVNGGTGTSTAPTTGQILVASSTTAYTPRTPTGTGTTPVLNNTPTLITPKLTGYTVATLPAGSIGMMAYVTDASSPVMLATVVGGGSTVVRVFYNGTNWIVQ